MKINISNLNFMAGKVHVFSDFDGTYMPESCSKLPASKSADLDNYCRETKEFLDKTKGDLSFTVTTGRRFGSYKKGLYQLQNSNSQLPIPDTLITGNGKELRNRIGGNIDFYETGVIPFDEIPEQSEIERSIEWEKMYKDGRNLNKLYDTKKKIASVIKENDLLITIGDGSNDFDMLNPLNYIDMQKYKEKSKNKEFFSQHMHKKLEDIKAIYNGENSEYINKLRKEFTENGLLKEIEKLPLVCITIRRGPSHQSLKPIYEAFASTGKVIEMEKGDWVKTIKEFTKKYAEQTSEFKEGMSDSFHEFITGKKKNIEQKVKEDSNKKTKFPFKTVGISSIVALIIGGACLLIRQNDKKVSDNKPLTVVA